MWCGRAGQVKPWVTWADVLTALRVPLAVAFPFVHHPAAQLGVVAAVAVCQLLTLVAFIADSSFVRPLAWATAAIGLYAIWDYGRAATRAGRSVTAAAAREREEGQKA